MALSSCWTLVRRVSSAGPRRRHSRSTAEFLGQILPGKTGPQNEEDPGHARPVIDGFADRISEAALPGRDKGLHEFPKVVGEKFSIHRGPHVFPPTQGSVPEIREDYSF